MVFNCKEEPLDEGIDGVVTGLKKQAFNDPEDVGGSVLQQGFRVFCKKMDQHDKVRR